MCPLFKLQELTLPLPLSYATNLLLTLDQLSSKYKVIIYTGG